MKSKMTHFVLEGYIIYKIILNIKTIILKVEESWHWITQQPAKEVGAFECFVEVQLVVWYLMWNII